MAEEDVDQGEEARAGAAAHAAMRQPWHVLAVLTALAAIFLALVLLAGLGPGPAVLAFLVTALLWVLAGGPVGDGAVHAVVAVGSRAAASGRACAGAVVEALPEACFLLDAEGRVVARNAAAERLLSPVRKGEHIAIALRAPEVLEALQESAEGGRAVSVRYLERVPVTRWLEAHVAPVALPEEVRAGGGLRILVLHDLTQEQRLERMRADFVANASHELRTPLASLLGFIETLQGPARDDAPARERFLEIMRQQAMRMARLISDLMSLSRVELNAHVRPDTVVDLAEILGHVRDAMAVLARDTGVDITVHLDEGPLTVRGDRDELIQVFQNLIENAVKYGQQGRRVEIEARRLPAGGGGEADRIEVAVRDFGPGIPPEHVPRLTERFYRVDVASSREKGGTGLGLAIVKHILNRHRAHLTVESQLGEGATFRLRFEAEG